MGSTQPPPPGQTHCRVDDATLALLRAAQSGDREAFATLYQHYRTTVRRFVAARVRAVERDWVDDLVQDTFCTALTELGLAHDDVAGWLLQLATRMLTRHRWSRRRYLRAALTIGEQQRISQHEAPAPTADTIHSWRVVAQALAELRPDERRTVQLRFLDGQSRQTAASLMNCSPWTVSRRQRRALGHLASRLAATTAETGSILPALAGGRPAPDEHRAPDR